MTQLVVADLLTKCEQVGSGCWEWTGARHKQGYGQIGCGGSTQLAHRVMFAAANGMTMKQIENLVVRHACDNPPCVNPMHLEPGDLSDNVQDWLIRGRRRMRVGAPGTAVMTDEIVTQMRRRVRAGEPVKKLAAEFGVSLSGAYQAVRGSTWSFLEEPPVLSSPQH